VRTMPRERSSRVAFATATVVASGAFEVRASTGVLLEQALLSSATVMTVRTGRLVVRVGLVTAGYSELFS